MTRTLSTWGCVAVCSGLSMGTYACADSTDGSTESASLHSYQSCEAGRPVASLAWPTPDGLAGSIDYTLFRDGAVDRVFADEPGNFDGVSGPGKVISVRARAGTTYQLEACDESSCISSSSVELAELEPCELIANADPDAPHLHRSYDCIDGQRRADLSWPAIGSLPILRETLLYTLYRDGHYWSSFVGPACVSVPDGDWVLRVQAELADHTGAILVESNLARVSGTGTRCTQDTR